MNIEIRRQPRIVTDILIQADSEWFDILELRAICLTLDIGDFEVDDAFSREIITRLSRVDIAKTYREDDRIMAGQGPKYDEFREVLAKALMREDLPPLDD